VDSFNKDTKKAAANAMQALVERRKRCRVVVLNVSSRGDGTWAGLFIRPYNSVGLSV
jgi:hypothetical protein